MQTEQIPVLKADEYPGGIWYYEPHTYQPCLLYTSRCV